MERIKESYKSMTSYKVLYPGGNTTAILTESLPPDLRVSTAQKIMNLNKEIEQVGFLSTTPESDYDIELGMMGGEFCVNAARCAAFIWNQMTASEKVLLKVSGLDSILRSTVVDDEVTLFFPKNFLNSKSKVDEGMLIDFLGISFLVSDEKFLGKDFDLLIKKYGSESPAFGLVTITEETNNRFGITPLIWVRDTETVIEESGCGSGSLAACLVYREKYNNDNTFSVIQPSGSDYTIIFNDLDDSEAFSLGGKVIQKEDSYFD